MKSKPAQGDEAAHETEPSSTQKPASANGRTCYADAHITALNSRAAAFEALGQLDKAQRDAENLVNMAPLRLEPYLRLGKVERLQKNTRAAYKTYCRGINVGIRHAMTNTPAFKVKKDHGASRVCVRAKSTDKKSPTETSPSPRSDACSLLQARSDLYASLRAFGDGIWISLNRPDRVSALSVSPFNDARWLT